MSEEKLFAIACEENLDLFWSITCGWVATPTFDLFTEEERKELNLPVGGTWVQMTG